jgi:hypothetical protein
VFSYFVWELYSIALACVADFQTFNSLIIDVTAVQIVDILRAQLRVPLLNEFCTRIECGFPVVRLIVEGYTCEICEFMECFCSVSIEFTVGAKVDNVAALGVSVVIVIVVVDNER